VGAARNRRAEDPVARLSVPALWTGAVLALLLLGGLTASATAARAQAPDAKAMVLALSDLPAGFSQEAGYYADNARIAAESSSVSPAEYARWGRLSGYEARFTRAGNGGLVRIESVASTYRSIGGARDSLHASFRVATGPNEKGWVFKLASIQAPLGDEARLYTTKMTTSGGTHAVLYVLFWRYRTVKAFLYGGGRQGTVSAESVIALAQTQERKIEAALTPQHEDQPPIA
jgi:hypothetical protein